VIGELHASEQATVRVGTAVLLPDFPVIT